MGIRLDGQLPQARQPDGAEQRFYAVMHQMATVLWITGATVEALAALSAVVEWVGQQAEGKLEPQVSGGTRDQGEGHPSLGTVPSDQRVPLSCEIGEVPTDRGAHTR